MLLTLPWSFTLPFPSNPASTSDILHVGYLARPLTSWWISIDTRIMPTVADLSSANDALNDGEFYSAHLTFHNMPGYTSKIMRQRRCFGGRRAFLSVFR